ncbi:response regulator transcription factor [Desulfovibrio gilichinskyi]|uniref:Two-component system, OmpR family, response regulator n=1 Tax=Desulfovibrio gilichinskyi TaxID=1519643 RepID=A0A1X7EJU8_9BACT|nr:response regulator transcription factor [Desulfovibrio gilichinskyi]SMF35144.1 two-component system, OmpR family, response regulator [Desulfovibrio gilichinskyi]
MKKTNRILIVDDDIDLGILLTEYLEAEGFNPHVVHNGIEGAAEALSGMYDVVLLDIMLPGQDGIEVLHEIRRSSRVPIIMLTAKGDQIDRVLGLEMGADDYMPKPCYPRELVARLRAVLRRTDEMTDIWKDDELRLGLLKMQVPQRKVHWDEIPVELTLSEFNCLEILLRMGERVVSKDELSEKVLGRAREPYDRSVDVHISNLRQKLAKVAGEKITIKTVRGVGYRVHL